MSIDRLVNVLVTITLIEMMVTVGLRVTFAEIIDVARNGRLVTRAAIANYLLVPAVAIVLLLVFQANPMVAVGFVVLAVCPGAPYGPPFARIARADSAVAVGLMVILAGSSAVVSPMLLSFLLPWVSGGEAARIEPIGMLGTLLITQLLPLLGGLVLNHWRPALAVRLLDPFELASKVMNAPVAGLILVTQFHMLLEIKIIGFVGMLSLLAASLVMGWLAGGPEVESRKAMALTTALRNAGVALVIVTGTFAGTPAATAALAYGIFAVLGSLLVALWWSRTAPAPGRVRP